MLQGIETLYLVTDHETFYERYGWEFFCMVQGMGKRSRQGCIFTGCETLRVHRSETEAPKRKKGECAYDYGT